jgi:hypothetical protein
VVNLICSLFYLLTNGRPSPDLYHCRPSGPTTTFMRYLCQPLMRRCHGLVPTWHPATLCSLNSDGSQNVTTNFSSRPRNTPDRPCCCRVINAPFRHPKLCWSRPSTMLLVFPHTSTAPLSRRGAAMLPPLPNMRQRNGPPMSLSSDVLLSPGPSRCQHTVTL